MLRLRPYKACDAQVIVSWIKDEVTFRKWCADRFEKYPITEEDMNARYNSLAYTDNFFQMTAFDILKAKKITLGVFENNEPAYYCYKSVGFQDIQLEQVKIYHVLNEDWICRELELNK